MSITRIICEDCGFPQVYCQCENIVDLDDAFIAEMDELLEGVEID